MRNFRPRFKYEKVRLFETRYSQDLYSGLANFADQHFFVGQCTDKSIREQALKKIRQMLH